MILVQMTQTQFSYLIFMYFINSCFRCSFSLGSFQMHSVAIVKIIFMTFSAEQVGGVPYAVRLEVDLHLHNV